MTPRKHPPETTQAILERILDTVESIDRIVDEIRDQLRELTDHAAYASWSEESYGWNHGPD